MKRPGQQDYKYIDNNKLEKGKNYETDFLPCSQTHKKTQTSMSINKQANVHVYTVSSTF